jgi:hypothetical protein
MMKYLTALIFLSLIALGSLSLAGDYDENTPDEHLRIGSSNPIYFPENDQARAKEHYKCFQHSPIIGYDQLIKSGETTPDKKGTADVR